jgi:hypothetical protein
LPCRKWEHRLPDKEFKITLIIMLKVLSEKVDNVKEYISNIVREMEILIKIEKEVLEIKKADTEMRSAFYWLINRLGTTNGEKNQCAERYASRNFSN